MKLLKNFEKKQGKITIPLAIVVYCNSYISTINKRFALIVTKQC